LEYIEECLPGEVENEVLKIFKHSKYELMRSVMKDLAIKDVFHYFIMFISVSENRVFNPFNVIKNSSLEVLNIVICNNSVLHMNQFIF
jgi:hypothetical protein